MGKRRVRLHIEVVGRPAPQGSKRTGGAGQLLESSAYLPAWRAAIRIGAFKAYATAGIDPQWLPVFPVGVPVAIERCVFWVTPDQCRASGMELAIGKPDIDKLLRSTLDALGGGRYKTARLYDDDSQIIAINGLAKMRPTGGRRPGASITISDGKD